MGAHSTVNLLRLILFFKGIRKLLTFLFVLENYAIIKIINMLTPEEKTKIIEKYKLHKADTGSAEVQIVLLTEEIKKLLSHLKKHSKDFHSKRGLLKMVSKRRKLLKYLKKENEKSYNKIVKAVGLKR